MKDISERAFPKGHFDEGHFEGRAFPKGKRAKGMKGIVHKLEFPLHFIVVQRYYNIFLNFGFIQAYRRVCPTFGFGLGGAPIPFWLLHIGHRLPPAFSISTEIRTKHE